MASILEPVLVLTPVVLPLLAVIVIRLQKRWLPAPQWVLFAAAVGSCAAILGLLIHLTLDQWGGSPRVSLRFPWPIPIAGSPLLFQPAVQVDMLSIPLLCLLPLIALTVLWTETTVASDETLSTSLLSDSSALNTAKLFPRSWSPSQTLLMLAGCSALVIADDVLTLGAGICLVLAAVGKTSEDNDVSSAFLFHQIIGWSVMFVGISWLAGIASLLLAAPHGLPGSTTFIFSDLADQVGRTATQHPAAAAVWSQYQRLPIFTALIATALLTGGVPFHRGMVRMLSNQGICGRIWLLALSKIVLLILYRVMIEVDPLSWAASTAVLVRPGMILFAYTSYLLMASADEMTRIGRLAVWSQQAALFSFLVAPESSSLFVLSFTVCHLAGLVLLMLTASLGKARSRSVGMFLALMTLSLSASPAGMAVFWSISKQVSAQENFGALAFVVFVLSCLTSIAGMLSIFRQLNSTSEQETSRPIHVGIFIWGVIAIATSMGLPLYLKAFGLD